MKIGLLLLSVPLMAYAVYILWRRTVWPAPVFWTALVFKLVAGVAVGVVYSWYYTTGDTFGYFEDGVLLAQLARTDIGTYLQVLWSPADALVHSPAFSMHEPRALFMVKIVSIACLFSYDNYWVCAVIFSFVSFVASWYLVENLGRLFAEARPAAAIAFLFFPSVVFWSAGVIKESMAMACLYFLSVVFLKLWFAEKVKVIHYLLLLPAVWVLWNLKYYFAGVYFAVVVTALLHKRLIYRRAKQRSFMGEVAVWLLIFIVPLVAISFFHPNFYPERLLRVIAENYEAYYALSAPEDLIHFRVLTQPVAWVLVNAPWALISGLFRPFIWEAHNLFQGVVALENTVLLAAFATCIFSVKPVLTSPHRMLFFACAVYVVALSVFITLSTPNFGTLSRYRLGYLPYFIFMLLCSPALLRILQRTFNRLVMYKR
jgi:hypothetical protein